MHAFKTFLRLLCAFIISAGLAAWLFVAVVNATILNKNVVKSWLSQSGIYSKNLSDFVPLTGNDNQVVTTGALAEAFSKTFTPDFIQKTTETIIDSTYTWLDTGAAITFNVPLQDKAPEFTANLKELLIPKLQQLPPCAPNQAPDLSALTCLPPGTNPSDFTNQLTKLSDNGAFALTEQSLQQNSVRVDWLPGAVKIFRALFYILPALIVLCAASIVLLSDDKLNGLIRVGRNIAISSALPLLVGVTMWLLGKSLDLNILLNAATPQQVALLVTSYISPLLKTILPSVGAALTIYSGAAMAAGAVTWVTAHILHSRKHSESNKEPADQKPNVPNNTDTKETVQEPKQDKTPTKK